MLYQDARAKFERARDKKRGALLPGRLGATRLIETDNGYGILFHQTVVVEIHPDNTYTLNSGGYHTSTTKERINLYSPVSVHQSKFVWYIDNGVPFSDGMRVDAKGIPIGPVKPAKQFDAMLNKINAYVEKYTEALEAKTIPKPSSDDCFFCSMYTSDGKSLGDIVGTEHLELHLEESYLVPALLWNAIKASGYQPEYVNPWNGLTRGTAIFKRALKTYLRKALCK